MKRILIPFLALPALLLAPSTSSAADHYDAYDGDFVTSDNERHHDIVDVFTFPSADKKRLVMIMNTYNRANASSMFDDKLAYTFRVMTGKTGGQGNEYRFTCRFSEGKRDGANEAAQNADCNAYKIVADPKSSTGRKAKSVLEKRVVVDTVSTTTNSPFRIFVGRRADAFFGDAAGLGEMLSTRKLPDAFKGPITNVGPRNLTAITDDLSIVIEVDFAAVFEEKATAFRVAVETAYPKREK
jgi:hypothetical protein